MNVIITNEAWQRLEKELDFLIAVRQIPKTKALSIGKKLVKRAKTLSRQPEKGQYEPDLSALNQGHRRLIEGNFKIIYFVTSDKVYVTDFFNTRRNPGEMKS